MSVRINVKSFPEPLSEAELNGDLFDFYKNEKYVGWLTKQAIKDAPIELLGKVRYYLVDQEFLEPPTFKHVPECIHENYGWIWNDEKRAYDCCHCRILINDPYMREMQDSNYEAWRSDPTST